MASSQSLSVFDDVLCPFHQQHLLLMYSSLKRPPRHLSGLGSSRCRSKDKGGILGHGVPFEKPIQVISCFKQVSHLPGAAGFTAMICISRSEGLMAEQIELEP